MKAVSGSLLSIDVLRRLPRDPDESQTFARVIARSLDALGPASSARTVFDLLARPAAAALRLGALPVSATHDFVASRAADDALLVATAWNADLRVARERTRVLATGLRWWIGLNGRTMRILDLAAGYSRRATDVELDRVRDDLDAAGAICALFKRDGSEALGVLAAAVTFSDSHRIAVSRTLERGVEDALARLVAGLRRARRRHGDAIDEPMRDALTVVYRMLFLLFAEARGLVPHWHPTYRRSYTLESLRAIAERGRATPGLWEAIQAISRLAHRGCRAGTLRVTPFNGRLFAPASAPLAETVRVADDVARDALLALTTRPGRDRRERITYADLGVEQLGAVYERVLDLAPTARGDVVTLRPTGTRKATGTFYTPRQMTEYLVRRTLAPLVDAATPEQVLGVRVLDPAMGSGAFLVAACRYLAEAYERALLREGAVSAADISLADRAAFRRAIAQRCLYGVDRNPMAVQVARLSLWLCTLAADRPLSFLDHHLRSGNSLVGARAADIARQPPGPHRKSRVSPLPLFGDDDLRSSVEATLRTRDELASVPDDSADVVRRKERLTDALASAQAPLGRLRTVADAWCAAWFAAEQVTPALWGALRDALAGRTSSLPQAMRTQWAAALAEIAARESFFHWELEFPEVFFEADGIGKGAPGFDALIGNPPWDVLRGDVAARTAAFARQSGVYEWQGDGHANLYQLFAERMFRLTRPGGRFGWLMPSGLMADHGSAALRRALFGGSRVDALLSFENRDAIFPIHRGLKFILLTGTRGGVTTELPARVGMRAPAVLDDVPDRGELPGAVHLPLTLVRQFSGDGMAVPEITTVRDRAIVAGILEAVPALGSPDGWNARFGRELNATDDKSHFGRSGLPVLEGKLLDPFSARAQDATSFIDRGTARRLLAGQPFVRARLGYREVASATNRLTLIAAVIPPNTVTTHTIFCLKTPAPEAVHWYLCAVFNSFVANYLVRLRGGTHVPAAVVHRLPVPVLAEGDERYERLVSLAHEISGDASEDAWVELQARAARLYRLTPDDFEYVLSTFPLVDAGARAAVARAFRARFNAI